MRHFFRKLLKRQIVDSGDIKLFIDIYSRANRDFHPRGGGNWHNIDRKTANLGYGWIHYGLIRNLYPRRVLIIGSRYGFIPAICALACRDNQKGKVDFVDAGFNYKDEQKDRERAWGGVGFWRKKNVERHFGKFKLNDYINFHLTTSKKFYQRHLNRRWDYIHLDGDHSYQGVKLDWQRFWPQLRKGGLIAFHDIYIRELGGLKYGVRKLWRELKAEKRYNMMEFPGDCGLGIMQK